MSGASRSSNASANSRNFVISSKYVWPDISSPKVNAAKNQPKMVWYETIRICPELNDKKIEEETVAVGYTLGRA